MTRLLDLSTTLNCGEKMFTLLMINQSSKDCSVYKYFYTMGCFNILFKKSDPLQVSSINHARMKLGH